MKTSYRIKTVICAFVLAGITLGNNNTASQAAPVLFASIDSLSSGSWNFTNAGAGSTFGVTGSIPVTFRYQNPPPQTNLYDTLRGTTPGTAIPATIAFSSTVSGFGTEAGSPISITQQGLTNISMTVTATTPQGGLTNLVSFNAASGELSGRADSTTFTLSVDTGIGDTLAYTSDFLRFQNVTRQQLNFSFTVANPTFNLAANNYVNSLASDAGGTFGVDPRPLNPVVVPEAGSVWLMFFAVVGLGVGLRRRGRFAPDLQ